MIIDGKIFVCHVRCFTKFGVALAPYLLKSKSPQEPCFDLFVHLLRDFTSMSVDFYSNRSVKKLISILISISNMYRQKNARKLLEN